MKEWATENGQLVYGPDGGPFQTAIGEPALKNDGSPVTAADVTGPTDPGGVGSLHCQKLFWDIPTPPSIGALVIAAAYNEDSIPRWPNGFADRIPPLYVDGAGVGFEKPCFGGLDVDSDGTCDGSAPRDSMCGENEVPWWAPVFAKNGSHPEGVNEPIIANFNDLADIKAQHDSAGKDSYVFLPAGIAGPDGILNKPGSPSDPQSGEVFRLECRRGVRTYYGPWQTGTDPNDFDALFEGTTTRFDTAPILEADAAAGNLCVGDGPDDTCTCVSDPETSGEANPIDVNGLACAKAGAGLGDTVPATGKVEWNTGSDFYNHFASHHGTCWNPETTLTSGALAPNYKCNDPDDPWAASDYESGGGECYDYQQTAEHRYDHPNCQADPDCMGSLPGQMFRNATQYPGRLYVEIPEERGVLSLDKQAWRCDHHVVLQLPEGSYNMTKLANYRLQKGGIMNPRKHGVNCGMSTDNSSTPVDERRSCKISLSGVGTIQAGSGQYLGGSVGEMVIQYFTDPYNDESVKPVNVQFEVIQDAATTYYPPFTFHAHKINWWAPFDLAIGLITTHSHHRNSIGFLDISPANPLRQKGRDNTCGGSENGEIPPHVYTNTDWEAANLCEYWKEPDGPLVMRKGQTIQTTCYVNHGITPEAIKQGLVAGDLVEAFRVYNEAQSGDPVIPRNEDLKTVPTSEWATPFVRSPVGVDFLYGTHPAINYRAAYKCSPNPFFNTEVYPVAGNAEVCDPNPAKDPDGDYIDGPYVNDRQCATGEWCTPSPIIFANVGEDEMCIPVFMFWRLDNLLADENGNPGLNEASVANLAEGAEHSIEQGNPNFFLEAIDETGTPGAVQKWPGDIGDCRDCKAVGY